MNVERLHLVAQAVVNELAEFDLVDLVGRLRSGLQNFVANPSDAGAQQQIGDSRSQLARLADAPSNSWTPSDRQILDELGISDLLGAALLERIEAIMTRNEMTPSVALEEISPIHDRLTEVATHLSELLTAMGFFGISEDELVDHYEVGVAIPRGFVDNNLPELGQEFIELQEILEPFEELAGLNRPAFEVRSLASSDFSVYLAAVPGAAFFIAKAVKEVEDAYLKWLEIKRLRSEMAEQDVPEDRMSAIDRYINEVMDARLKELAAELVAQSPATLDEGRRNELTIEVGFSLNKLANRIDEGYSVDVRTPPPPEAPTEGEEGDEAAVDERNRAIATRELAARIRRIGAPGKRILQLPEGESSSPEQEN